MSELPPSQPQCDSYQPPPSPDASPSSWRGRLSYPPLPIPNFRANIPNFRAALLGYLEEIELALRRKLEDGQVGERSSESPIDVVGEWAPPVQDHSEGEQGNIYSSARAGPSSGTGLRQRGPYDSQLQTPLASPSLDTYIHLLEHLSALREEASKHLPSLSMPSVALPLSIPNREWIRALPTRLSMVDPALPFSDGQLAAPSEINSGAIEGARKRVVDMVHAVLPSEEWAGWEKLGWEEQDDTEVGPGSRRVRSASLQTWGQDGDDDDDDEPEYFFPNRTPASAKTLARRRAVRSKSLGAVTRSAIPSGSPLDRSQTGPAILKAPSEPGEPGHVERGNSRDETEGDEDEVAYFPDNPERTNTPTVAKGVQGTGPSVVDALKKAEDGRQLINYDDLPAVWRNNEHILTGYRFIPLHLKTGPVPLLKSAFMMHNETVNIHLHSIPTIVILCVIPFIAYNSPLPDAHPLDTAFLICYLIAATSCMVSSAGWHVLSGCASRRWFEWGACVDYIGISWLIAASFGTLVYDGFYCQPKATVLYCTTNLLCAALGSYLPFQRWFNERKNKSLRISFFLFLCLAMVAPLVHMSYEHGWDRAAKFVSPFGASILSYITGLVFYAFHFPECRWPGMFDTWGASHQIWHAAIVLAVVLHCRAIFAAHGVRYAYSCLAPGQTESVPARLERILGWERRAG